MKYYILCTGPNGEKDLYDANGLPLDRDRKFVSKMNQHNNKAGWKYYVVFLTILEEP